MIRIILFFFVLAVLALIGAWAIEHDGVIAIQWLGYHIKTTSSFAVLTLLTVIVFVTLILLGLSWIRHTPDRITQHYSNKKRDRGLTALTQGFAAIAAEDTYNAKRYAQIAEKGLGGTPLTALLNMQRAQLEHNDHEVKRYLADMMNQEETKLIAIKGLLLHAQKEGNIRKAVSLAEQAQSHYPKTRWVPPLLAELYAQDKQWEKAITALEAALKQESVDKDKATIELGMAHFFFARKVLIEGDSKEALHHARKSHALLPDFVPGITLLSEIYQESEQKRKAAKLLEKAWDETPHPDILAAYHALYQDDSKEKHLKRIESLTRSCIDIPESHLAVAQAAMAAKSYSKARNHLKLALQKLETVSVYKMMAELEKQESGSNHTIQEWLNKVANASQDPAWVCNQCHYSLSDIWQDECPNCHTFNSFSWKKATKVHTIPSEETS